MQSCKVKLGKEVFFFFFFCQRTMGFLHHLLWHHRHMVLFVEMLGQQLASDLRRHSVAHRIASTRDSQNIFCFGTY